MNEIKVTKVNVDLFKDFLNKLVGFDKNVFIKISNEKVTSQTYFPNKDAVKIVELNTEDVFEFSTKLTSTIKVAFYNAREIITALSFFTNDNVKGKIQYDIKNDIFIATAFILQSDSEKFNLFCLDPNFSFTEMTDDEVKRVFEIEESEDNDKPSFANFELDFDTIKKIESRLKINKDESKFVIKVIDNKAFSITKNNELHVADDVEIKDDKVTSVTIFKKYLTLLDRENYKIYLCSNKVIFESLISDTKLAIAVAVDDDLDTVDDLNDDFSDLDNLQLD